jgi:hypothetical protein
MILAAFAAGLTATRTARAACTCAEQPARVLLPLPGAAHVAGAPIVVAASRPIETRLYDPRGNPVALPLVRQWEPLGACGNRYFVYQPRGASLTVPGEFQLQLGDESAKEERRTFSVIPPEGHRNITFTAELRLAYSAVEPYTSNAEMCEAPQLEDRIIDGTLEYTVTLSAAAPVFMEAWYVYPPLGAVRDYGSTIPVGDESTDGNPQTVGRVELPHLQGSDDCVEVRLYAWTLEPLLSDRICFMSQQTQTYTMQVELPEWHRGRTGEATERARRDLIFGCDVAPSSSSWGLSLGYFVGLAWLRRRRAHGASRR